MNSSVTIEFKNLFPEQPHRNKISFLISDKMAKPMETIDDFTNYLSKELKLKKLDLLHNGVYLIGFNSIDILKEKSQLQAIFEKSKQDSEELESKDSIELLVSSGDESVEPPSKKPKFKKSAANQNGKKVKVIEEVIFSPPSKRITYDEDGDPVVEEDISIVFTDVNSERSTAPRLIYSM